MNTPDQPFLQSIIDNPDDDARRLVFADWLEEQDQPERAEFIRLQCEVAKLTEGAPQRMRLESREKELLATWADVWSGELRLLTQARHYRRGFVEAVTISVQTLLDQESRLRSLAPLREIQVNIADFAVPPAVIAFFPPHVATHYGIMPLVDKDHVLYVAMADPSNGYHLWLLDCFLRRPFRPFRATREQLTESITRDFGQVHPLDTAEREPNGGQFILVEDVRRHLSQTDVPIRPGTIPFVWFPGPTGPDEVEARYQQGCNGFSAAYVLTAAVTQADLARATLTTRELRNVKVRYTDDAMEGAAIDASQVEALIAQLRQPTNKIDWKGQTIVPGGETIGFSLPMRKLMMLGSPARYALHRVLDDPEIQNEVVLVLGSVGDETTVPLLIDRYPSALTPEDPLQTKMVCFSFALSYLTGQQIDRTREGTTLSDENATGWKEWWGRVGRPYRLPVAKPRSTWVPSYPILTGSWARQVRHHFVHGDAAGPWNTAGGE